MNLSPKIQPQHLTRQAVVYIRQSTPKQVLTNLESTRRQYQLADQARQWGWPQPLILIIDDDLGLSGAESSKRLGFQRLVASISLGEVGLVLVTEVSRLSRLNSDWHRVIELCAVFHTLIADEDGVYDPRDPNDRLLLGLKGTLYSAELHILNARMRGNLLNKARRGELALRLPVGYRRRHDGRVVLEPDDQVRHTLQLLFEQFSQLKNARAVQRYFLQHELKMPRLIQCGSQHGSLLWAQPTYQMIYQVLTNPVYAGVFVYGRRKKEVQPGDPPLTRERRLSLEEWEIVVPDTYPAYISYDQYLANRRHLHDNMYNFEKKGRGAARQGSALLQGIIRCARCGRRMTVSHGSDYWSYQCRRAQMSYLAGQCQTFPVRYLDQAITEVFLEAIQPAQIETTLAALDVLEKQRQALDRYWQLRLERARYQVHHAQRQYDAVDPDNRLVARELEKRWNEALNAAQELEQEYAIVQRTELRPLDAEAQRQVRQLAEDLPAVWNAPTTTAVDRKRLLRVVIIEVTLRADRQTRRAEYAILWSGGAVTRHAVRLPAVGWHAVTPASVLERIRQMALTCPDHRIAEALNAEGIRTHTGREWTYQRVFSIRKQHQIPTNCPLKPSPQPARGDGLVSAKTAARQLQVSPSLIQLWTGRGVLVYDQRVSGSKLWVRMTEEDLARLNGSTDGQHLPTITAVMQQRQLNRSEVWEQVRRGEYVAYRVAEGKTWQWRLKRADGR